MPSSAQQKEHKKRITELREFLLDATPVIQHSSGRGYLKKTSAKQTFVKGLTKVLARTFYSDYEYIANKYQPKGASGLLHPGDGLRRGRIVHDQLQSYGNKSSTNRFLRENPKLHEYTHMAIAWMIKHDLEPVFAEFPVADATVSLGTGIDMLCVDRDFNIFMIEWKNGMNEYLHRASGQMTGPFAEPFSNSPFNQALLQLCFTRLFFENSTGMTVHKAYVVNVHEKGVTHYELPEELWEQRQTLYEHALTRLIMYEKQPSDATTVKKNRRKKRKLRKDAQKKRVTKNSRKSNLF